MSNFLADTSLSLRLSNFPANTVYCITCAQWLRGDQVSNHIEGRVHHRHARVIRRLQRQQRQQQEQQEQEQEQQEQQRGLCQHTKTTLV